MSFATASATPESVIAGMLAVLRVMAGRFVERFGDPAALAKGGDVYGAARERILRFLHDMECVVRRLLLLRAALFPAPDAGAYILPRRFYGQQNPRRRKEGDAVALFGLAGDAAQWRVCFRIATPVEPAFLRPGPQTAASARPPVSIYVNGHRAPAPETSSDARGFPVAYRVDDPRPLAERFEALRRVIDDPDHYAARLAQRLYLWRGRAARRAIFLQTLSARSPIANEAGLADEDWAHFGAAYELTLTYSAVFSAPRADPAAGEAGPPDPHSLPPPGAGP